MEKRILVVEDNMLVQEVYASALQQLDCDVVTADDGQEALELAAEETPDLIIMDVMLPGVSGLDLVRQMKADPALKDVPIIVVTTMATAGDESKVLETGADAYLAKPIQVDQFIEAVRTTLGL
ncbi:MULTISPECIES: response regulator [unclassified Minwuia]|jgi:two-component system, cell cycle response regulator DivK|uniref:response regulator n=1 Tax=unclassified Minwuia TaxID=2618799 RepID=UPI0024795B16|nr:MULTISPECIES: response regulator [unclassified Minwuia]